MRLLLWLGACLTSEAPLRTTCYMLCADGYALVPALWPTEVGNGLLVAERNGRISAPEIRLLLERLRALDIRVQPASLQQDAVLELARQHRLTVYDATYLHLAQQHRLRLATFDGALARAATESGIELL